LAGRARAEECAVSPPIFAHSARQPGQDTLDTRGDIAGHPYGVLSRLSLSPATPCWT
jgi:hypothetical protein